MKSKNVLEQLAAAEAWSEAGDVKRLFAASKAEIERLSHHNELLRDVLFEVARLWPTVKEAPADVVVARCEAISACVATTLYELSNPAAEVGIEGHEPGKRDSAPGQRVAGPACTTDRESGASHSEGGADPEASTSPFDQWVQQHAPHVYKHREGAFRSTYDAFWGCWNAALRLVVTPPGEPTRLCLKCGATYDKALSQCPLCGAEGHEGKERRMSELWKDRYYEQAARFTESNGMLTDERNRAIARAEKAEKELAEATRALSEGVRECEWTPCYRDVPPTEANYLNSGCGPEWMAGDDADPPGRWMKFCPFCGGKAVFTPLPDEAPTK